LSAKFSVVFWSRTTTLANQMLMITLNQNSNFAYLNNRFTAWSGRFR